MSTAILDAPPAALPAVAAVPEDLPVHIAARIEVRHVSVEDVEDPCWVWTGLVNDRGYGLAKVGDRVAKVHRTIYELLLGPVPPGLEVGQRCLVRACCNPVHLVTATRAEHTRRRKASSALSCVKGHPRMLETVLVLSRAEDGTVERETCRRCVQPRSRDLGTGAPPELVATAALVLSLT